MYSQNTEALRSYDSLDHSCQDFLNVTIRYSLSLGKQFRTLNSPGESIKAFLLYSLNYIAVIPV